MMAPISVHVLMVTAMLIVFASITTNFSSLTVAIPTQDVSTQMVLTSASVSQALSKMSNHQGFIKKFHLEWSC